MKTTLSNGSPVPCALRPAPRALCPVPRALCPVPCALYLDLKSILYNDEENNVSHRFVSDRI